MSSTKILQVILIVSVIITGNNLLNAATIIVDADGLGDFNKIQDAIDDASVGDTIRVFAGTYYGNVKLNKTISLIGNGTANTTLNGAGSGTVLHITADWVNISGFKITNSGESQNDAGIKR